MNNFFSSSNFIGLEKTPSEIKIASLGGTIKNPVLQELSTVPIDEENVKRLYIHHPVFITGLAGKEVLVRALHLPLVKEKDIQEALSFQAEPLLPYPVEQAFLGYQTLSKTNDGTEITLVATRKETVESHLTPWQNIQIEPEKIGAKPLALCEFGAKYFSSEKTFLIINLEQEETVCSLIKEGKLYTSFAHPEGFSLLVDALKKEKISAFPQGIAQWEGIEHKKESPLNESIKRLQREIARMGFASAKEEKRGSIEGVLLTGSAATIDGLSEILIKNLDFPLLFCPPVKDFSSVDLHNYAVPIGLALNALPGNHSVDFRQQELIYPHPWKRLVVPVAIYFAAIFLLTFSFYFFTQQYLRSQEDQIKQAYVDLLANFNRSHDDFEAAFAAKHPGSNDSFNGELPKIEQLEKSDFPQRLSFLQKELLATPDSFPLFANTPRVGDVLAWLSRHPAVVSIDENGKKEAKLHLENFHYIMAKRPQQGKKQEKYQVKVELEFTSEIPKLAREFHDALIESNDWVDPKGEVKWNSNRGKYKTSFFLKDKTNYPSISS